MFTSYRIATVWGIPIRLNWSLVIALLILARQFGWAEGLLVGIGFFTSIVLHELGHSLVALRKGIRVRQITLMCIGGAAQMDRLPERPRDEILLAIAGPIVSAVLGFTLIGLAIVLPMRPMASTGIDIFTLLGGLNIGLALFNLLPAFPMDGGRILRAALSLRVGRLRATAAAARIGQILAIGFGLYGLFHWNLLLIAVAFFVYLSAGTEYRHVRAQEQARRMGGSFWSFFDDAAPEPIPEDRVLISPPPYARGPHHKADIHPD